MKTSVEDLSKDTMKIIGKLMLSNDSDEEYQNNQDLVEVLELLATYKKPLSVTGALYQVGLAYQFTDRVDANALSWFEQQSLRAVRRSLHAVARCLIDEGADVENAQVRYLMPSVLMN